jgi:uncharacterized protein involved in tolerance to divalent cations
MKTIQESMLEMLEKLQELHEYQRDFITRMEH